MANPMESPQDLLHWREDILGLGTREATMAMAIVTENGKTLASSALR
jgi:hypothetical protein